MTDTKNVLVVLAERAGAEAALRRCTCGRTR